MVLSLWCELEWSILEWNALVFHDYWFFNWFSTTWKRNLISSETLALTFTQWFVFSFFCLSVALHIEVFPGDPHQNSPILCGASLSGFLPIHFFNIFFFYFFCLPLNRGGRNGPGQDQRARTHLRRLRPQVWSWIFSSFYFCFFLRELVPTPMIDIES